MAKTTVLRTILTNRKHLYLYKTHDGYLVEVRTLYTKYDVSLLPAHTVVRLTSNYIVISVSIHFNRITLEAIAHVVNQGYLSHLDRIQPISSKSFMSEFE